MPITYPITLPFAVRAPKGITITPQTAVGVESSPFSMQENVQISQGQRWMAQIDLPPMSRDTGAPEWFAALVSLNGSAGTFYLGDTAYKVPRGVATGTPLVNGGSQSGYDLVTDGWTHGVSGILKVGDWIQLGTGSGSHLHMVMATADSDSGGNVTLTLWPKLRSSPADNSAIVTSSPRGVFRLVSPAGWSIDEIHVVKGLTFQAVEALNP